ncbi:hypothetical protein I7I51_04430 [Histoplasma capsulatum]|uniref:Uncharacterized protein n=1 Tax=Ajellomyces capsulatus TaxID=5037 RepID=A0A8A1MC07_AJECA|nr:hypothetical protein I7I51_04430 [Histoplasma capsulatum]
MSTRQPPPDHESRLVATSSAVVCIVSKCPSPILFERPKQTSSNRRWNPEASSQILGSGLNHIEQQISTCHGLDRNLAPFLMDGQGIVNGGQSLEADPGFPTRGTQALLGH